MSCIFAHYAPRLWAYRAARLLHSSSCKAGQVVFRAFICAAAYGKQPLCRTCRQAALCGFVALQLGLMLATDQLAGYCFGLLEHLVDDGAAAPQIPNPVLPETADNLEL